MGIEFSRAATFSLPERIQVGSESFDLLLPAENGVKVSFIDILLDDCYGCARTDGPVKTVLDIGANVGLFGLMARRMFPDATIHCYEPNPALEKYLLKQSVPGNYKYFMEAIGRESGSVALAYKGDSVLTQSVPDSNGSITKTAFRDAISRLGERVDFLKLDCEGAEWELFEDAESWAKIERVSMEYHLTTGHSAREALSRLNALGFKIDRHTPCEGFGLIVAGRG